MKNLFLLVYAFGVVISLHSQLYEYQPCPGVNDAWGKDTILLSDGYHEINKMYGCNYTGSLYYEELTVRQKDSVNGFIKLLLEPYFDKWVSKIEPVELVSFDMLKEEITWLTEDETRFCNRVKSLIICRLCFNEGAMITFPVSLGIHDEILNAEEIPALHNLEKWEVISPCRIYHLASNEDYFGKYTAMSASVDLKYSPNKQLFYYEVWCAGYEGGKEYDASKGGTQTFYRKVMFMDAITGKILWKTKIKEEITVHHAIDNVFSMNYNHPLLRKPKKKRK